MLVFLRLAYHASIRLSTTIYLPACLPAYLRHLRTRYIVLFVFLRGHEVGGTNNNTLFGGWSLGVVRWVEERGVAYMHYYRAG